MLGPFVGFLIMILVDGATHPQEARDAWAAGWAAGGGG